MRPKIFLSTLTLEIFLRKISEVGMYAVVPSVRKADSMPIRNAVSMEKQHFLSLHRKDVVVLSTTDINFMVETVFDPKEGVKVPCPCFPRKCQREE